MARTVEKVEFAPEEPGALLRHMTALAEAHDGWVNLLPGIADDRIPEPRAHGPLASLFGSNRSGVTMATWMPPSHRRPGACTVGLMHPPGRAVPALRQAGAPVPEGWRVRQDHVRRGLLLEVPADVAPATVVAWAVAAGTALCTEEMTGRWRADVYLPRVAPG